MWCTQSKHNFTGYEFAWDAVYLVEPGFGCACRNGGTLQQPSKRPWILLIKAVTGDSCFFIGSPWDGTKELWTGRHPSGFMLKRRRSLCPFLDKTVDESFVILRALVFWVICPCYAYCAKRCNTFDCLCESGVLVWDWEMPNMSSKVRVHGLTTALFYHSHNPKRPSRCWYAAKAPW